jgi:hypothetical protein
MRVFKPRGVSIFRRELKRRNGDVVVDYACTIKGKGRTGSRIRQRLMQLSHRQRQYVLPEWAKGRCVEVPGL